MARVSPPNKDKQVSQGNTAKPGSNEGDGHRRCGRKDRGKGHSDGGRHDGSEDTRGGSRADGQDRTVPGNKEHGDKGASKSVDSETEGRTTSPCCGVLMFVSDPAQMATVMGARGRDQGLNCKE